MKYRPASKTMKKEQILADSEAKAKQNCLKKEKPFVVKFGLNHVTKLIENRTAQLVVIAHDVEPVEIVCWVPSLCKINSVPYLIINGKARLGQIVHKKTATIVALVGVKNED